MTRLAAVVFIVLLTLAEAASAQCTYESITCSGRKTNRLENATCRFSNNNQPFFMYTIDAVAGQVLDIFLQSSDFAPYLAVYEADRTLPTKDDRGFSIARVTFDVPRTGRYRIAAAADDGRTRGIFELSLYCQTVCKAPFGTSATSVLSIPFGTRATLNVGADGTPPLTFRWYEAARPGVTLATTTTNIFTTEPLFASTTINVDVSNACGTTPLTAAIISVVPCTAPAITTHPVSRTVRSGELVALTAAASGSQPMTFQWYRGIPPDTSRPVGIAGGPTFSIIMTPALQGPYFARASNGCGSADTNPAVIDVEGGTRRRTVRH